jgi:hypothetical protein
MDNLNTHTPPANPACRSMIAMNQYVYPFWITHEGDDIPSFYFDIATGMEVGLVAAAQEYNADFVLIFNFLDGLANKS